ncbi:hypothetical protein [Streptodolium elevatio]|uniref:Uncharacterized protein n=1 Tax=Streptodolium elevatio TaxID=3157996 RepID=A0ABV3D9K7_9ACTN
MPKTARHQLSRIVGTSCLAVALALPVTAVTAGAAPAAAPAALPGDTPPPPQPPDPPDPDTPEPDGPKTPAEPDGPNSPAEPDGPSSADPGTPSDDGPSTPSDESSSSPAIQNLVPPEQKKALEDQIAKLDAPDDVKKQLKESLDKAAAAIADPKTTPADKAAYEKYVSGLDTTLKAINNPQTTPEDRAALLTAMDGANAAIKLATDPKTSAADKTFYAQLGEVLANASTQLQDKNITVEQKAALVRNIKIISAGLVALADPKTAPPKEEDKKKVQEVLERNTQALATLQDPNASTQEKATAQKTLDEAAAATQNPQYLAFLEEVKKYDPSTECLDTITARTEQAGWPDGSFWGLADESCDDTLADAVKDTDSKWNQVFECVQNSAFSTCAAYIPETDN